LLLVAALLFSWLDPGDTWKRWEQAAYAPELAVGDRIAIAKDTLRLAREHLPYGVGMGAFEVAYPKYQTVATDLVINYAHNDYAQLLAEAGILGWICLPLSIAGFIGLSFRRLRLAPLTKAGWIQLGAAVGVCGILVHSFSDFNLHVPANAAWFTFCAALAAAVSPHQGSALRDS
jgi:O-antigen ligase